MVVVFDVVGTLFSLQNIHDELLERNMSPMVLPWWFARILHAAMATTLTRQYTPFALLAETSLEQVLEAGGYPREATEPIMEQMQELKPWPDAAQCLAHLRERGHTLIALTNSSADAANSLLEKAGFRGAFVEVLSADAVAACKPDPRPYRMALERARCKPAEACLVAAHGWDILGAHAVGMRTVWVTRLEKRWPFPGSPPGGVGPTLAQVPEQLGLLQGRL